MSRLKTMNLLSVVAVFSGAALLAVHFFSPQNTVGATNLHTNTPKPTNTRSLRPVGKLTASSSEAVHTVVGLDPASGETEATTNVQQSLEAVVAQYTDLHIGVELSNLTTGQMVGVNAGDIFTAASTTKVLVAAAYLHQVELGTASFDTDIGGYSASDMLQQMINQSNNYAWEAFINYLGTDNLRQYALDHELASYNPVSNMFSASDDVELLTQLGNGTLLNPSNTERLLGYMTDTNEEGLIPAALPGGTTVAHKYGILEGKLHDGALVTVNGNRYVLAIYTENDGTELYDRQTEAIHALTKVALGLQ